MTKKARIALIAAFSALALFISLYIVPNEIRYQEGLRLIRLSEWDKAAETYSRLAGSGYRDSRGMSYYCYGRKLYSMGYADMAWAEFGSAADKLSGKYKTEAENWRRRTYNEWHREWKSGYEERRAAEKAREAEKAAEESEAFERWLEEKREDSREIQRQIERNRNGSKTPYPSYDPDPSDFTDPEDFYDYYYDDFSDYYDAEDYYYDHGGY